MEPQSIALPSTLQENVERRICNGLGLHLEHDHAGSLHAGCRLRGSLRAFARRRPFSGPPLRDRFECDGFSATSAMVQRRPSLCRRKTACSCAVDRGTSGFTRCSGARRVVLGRRSERSGCTASVSDLRSQENAMSGEAKAAKKGNGWRLSLDTWAVLVALFTALLVRFGVFKHVPW